MSIRFEVFERFVVTVPRRLAHLIAAAAAAAIVTVAAPARASSEELGPLVPDPVVPSASASASATQTSTTTTSSASMRTRTASSKSKARATSAPPKAAPAKKAKSGGDAKHTPRAKPAKGKAPARLEKCGGKTTKTAKRDAPAKYPWASNGRARPRPQEHARATPARPRARSAR